MRSKVNNLSSHVFLIKYSIVINNNGYADATSFRINI